MGELHASRTAISVAVLRAAHQLLDGEPKVLADPVAVGLVQEASEAALRAEADRLQRPCERRARADKVLRSRYAEDRFEEAARRGVTQCVVLGAGLDTFAYRQPPWARRFTIVEIDHPASQQFKMASLKSAGIAVPTNVRFLPVDFATDDLCDKLAGGPLDTAKPIVVSWLGVTQYLAREAIATTLGVLGSWPGGCEVTLTYVIDDWTDLEAEQRQTMEGSQTRAAEKGEPWLSKFSLNSMVDMLSAAGFSLVDPLTIEEAEKRYFYGRTDDLMPTGGIGIVSAKT
jgi:methyltransferase (TIGR00027 family)